MQTIWYLASHVLGITIIHSMWQGLIIYVLIRLWVLSFPATTSASKYKLAAGGMALSAMWFVYTLLTQVKLYSSLVNHVEAIRLSDMLPIILNHHSPISERIGLDLNRYLPYITIFYLCGFLFQSAKLSYAWFALKNLKRYAVAADRFQSKVDKLSACLKLSRPVRVMLSNRIDVPCVVGYIKPILLLPVTFATGLASTEIEAILLHELAHISRNDYLWNLLQQCIHTLLFFNPFVQLLNRMLNEEREHSCDDMVIHLTGQPLVYAQALLKLESSRQTASQHLMLAATGKKYHLLNRIQRIMKTEKPSGHLRHLLFSLLIIGISFSSIAWLNPELRNGKLSVKLAKPAIINHLFTDTVPKHTYTARKRVAKKPSSRLTQDQTLAQLDAEIRKHSDAIAAFYKTPAFQNYMAQVMKQAEEASRMNISPDVQQRLDSLQKQLEQHNSSMNHIQVNETQLNKQLDQISAQLGNYYQSPEFRKLTEELGKESARLSKSKINSEEYKKSFWKLNQLSKSINDFNSQPQLKELQKQLNETTAAIVKPYNSDYIKEQLKMSKLQDSLDNLYKQFNVPDLRYHVDMKLDQFKDYPELQKQEVELDKATQKLNRYMRSPTFKKRLKAHTEKTEPIEKPEQPEIENNQGKPQQPDTAINQNPKLSRHGKTSNYIDNMTKMPILHR